MSLSTVNFSKKCLENVEVCIPLSQVESNYKRRDRPTTDHVRSENSCRVEGGKQ